MNTTHDEDADLLKDEGPGAMANHDGYFQRAQEDLEKDLSDVYRGRGGALELTAAPLMPEEVLYHATAAKSSAALLQPCGEDSPLRCSECPGSPS